MKDKAINTTTWAVIVCGALVLLAAGILSYSALYDLFLSMGLFVWWLAFLFPLLFDLAEVTAALAVWNHKLRGQENKWAWNRVIDFTLLGVSANCLHAMYAYLDGRIVLSQMVLAMFITSLFPVSVAIITHLLKQTIDLHVGEAEKGTTKESTDIEKALAEVRRLTKLVNEQVTTVDEVERRKLALVDYVGKNPGASYAEIGDNIDRSKTTVQKYVGDLIDEGVLHRNGNGLEVVR